MTGQSRRTENDTGGVAPAVVLPWAAYMIVREFEGALVSKARMLEVNPQTREIGLQLRQSVAWLKATAAAQFAANKRCESAPGETAKVSPSLAETSCVSPPRSRLSVREVAAQLDCSEQWVRILCRTEKLAATSTKGRRWVITQTAVDDYLIWRRGHGS